MKKVKGGKLLALSSPLRKQGDLFCPLSLGEDEMGGVSHVLRRKRDSYRDIFPNFCQNFQKQTKNLLEDCLQPVSCHRTAVMVEYWLCALANRAIESVTPEFYSTELMKTIATFVSGLLLSALLLLPATVSGADVQPFFMLKTASANALVSVAEKISTMAGVADNHEFQTFLKTVKGVKGFDLNGIIGVGAAVDENDDLGLILLLPITDLMKAEIPGFPSIFDQVRPFLVKKGNNFEIASPMGTYIAAPRKDCLIIASESIADKIPADAKKLFADLDKYTIGAKLDLEKVKFETLENTIFGPLQMFAAMADPTAGEKVEEAVDVYRELYKEYSAITYGIIFNPQTADLELPMSLVARKGSDIAKVLAETKQQPTIFGGFRGTPENTVLSVGVSQVHGKLDNNTLIDLNVKQIDTLFAGILEQMEMEDESGEILELIENARDSIKKILETESKRGSSDCALSLNVEGTLLAAGDTASLEEIRKLISLAVEFARKKDAEMGGLLKDIVAENLKQNYTTIEGFKVSNIKIPLASLHEKFAGPAPDELKQLTPGIFWAVKDAGGKQAIAVAIGWDFAKAEQSFKSALEKTKTPVPVQQPLGTIAVQGLGKMLQQTVFPLAEKHGNPDDIMPFKKVIDIFTKAGNDAVITITCDCKPNGMEMAYRISGKAIQAFIAAAKVGVEEARARIEDF